VKRLLNIQSTLCYLLAFDHFDVSRFGLFSFCDANDEGTSILLFSASPLISPLFHALFSRFFSRFGLPSSCYANDEGTSTLLFSVSPLIFPLFHAIFSDLFPFLFLPNLFCWTFNLLLLRLSSGWPATNLPRNIGNLGSLVPVLSRLVDTSRLRRLFVTASRRRCSILAYLRSNNQTLLGIRDNLHLRLLNSMSVNRWNQWTSIVFRIWWLSIIDLSFNIQNVVSNVLGSHFYHHVNISSLLSRWSCRCGGCFSLFGLFFDPFTDDPSLLLPELLLLPLLFTLPALYFISLKLFSFFLPLEVSLLKFPGLLFLKKTLLCLFLFLLLNLLKSCLFLRIL